MIFFNDQRENLWQSQVNASSITKEANLLFDCTRKHEDKLCKFGNYLASIKFFLHDYEQKFALT